MIEEYGEMTFADFDEANIPVNIFFSQIDEDDEEYENGFRWRILAENFMPRKQTIVGYAAEALSDNKEELQELIKKYVVPLYESALRKLKGMVSGDCDNFYYWE